MQQRRMSSCPNVLVVHVRRTLGGSSDVLRHPVLVEEEISLLDVGSFELSGVVYHSGRSATRPHYSCVSRGPERQFWRYDDKAAWRLPSDVGRVLPRSVYLLVYTLPKGIAGFAGMRELGTMYNRSEEARRGKESGVGMTERRDSVVGSDALSAVRRRPARGVGAVRAEFKGRHYWPSARAPGQPGRHDRVCSDSRS